MVRAQTRGQKDGKSRTIPARFVGNNRGMFHMAEQGSFWAQKFDSVVIHNLPMVTMYEFLDRLPLGTTELDAGIAKIDQTGNLDVFRDPKDLLDLGLPTGRR